MHCQRHAIDQAVRDLNRMNRERSDLEPLPGTNLAQISVVEKLVLVELVFDVGKSELGAPHRNIKFTENPGQAADVILVAMGEDDGANVLTVLEKIRDVGDNDVDPKQFGLGKHQASVNDNDVVSPAQGHAVHAELAKAAQRDNVQFSGWHYQR